MTWTRTWQIFLAAAIVLLWTADAYAQFVTQDWKLHDVGKVRQLITNSGKLNKLRTNYPGLINTEHPPNSFAEHLGSTGWYIGGVMPNGDTLVSVTHSFASADEFQGYSGEPWDTIWVANRGDSLQIPYAVPYPGGRRYTPESGEGYLAVSDQDLVTRYNDYNEASRTLNRHVPMGLDVIQTSYAWGSPPLDELVVVNYSVISREHDIRDVYLAAFVDGNVGLRTGAGFTFANDDFAAYYPKRNLGITFDAPGGPDGGEFTPIGVKVVTPEGVPPEELTWTYIWGDRTPVVPPERDPQRYEQMASGDVRQNQEVPNQVHYIMAFGPYDLPKGDTLHFKFALILGEDEEAILEGDELVDWIVSRDFQVPKPPPVPPARVTPESHEVTIRWDSRPGDADPEAYEDPNRADDVEQPFEGYRVYKSSQSATGPWTLLAEYDVPDNDYGQNAGLGYQITDRGLLNNVEYYYSVTAFSKEDRVANFPSQETSVNGNALTVVPGTAPPETVGQVAVVPNPYRGDIDYNSFSPPWEKPPPTREQWMEQDRRLQFINLPPRCRIEVYTVSGSHVETLFHDDPQRGYEDWNLTSRVGQAISSGLYLFTVEDLDSGETQVGKFVVIK